MVEHSFMMMLSYIYLAQEKIKCSIDRKMVRKNNKILRRYVREFIKRNRDIPILNVPGIYEFAYPKAMWFYWNIKAVMNKFKFLK